MTVLVDDALSIRIHGRAFEEVKLCKRVHFQNACLTFLFNIKVSIFTPGNTIRLGQLEITCLQTPQPWRLVIWGNAPALSRYPTQKWLQEDPQVTGLSCYHSLAQLPTYTRVMTASLICLMSDLTCSCW